MATPPMLRLPSELVLEIASLLPPRGVFAMMIALPTFPIIIRAFDEHYTHLQHVPLNELTDDFPRTYTALQYFCTLGHIPIVERLLQTGADANGVSIGDEKNQIPPLVLAIGFRSAALVELLLAHGALVDDRAGPAIPDDDPGTTLGALYREESPLHIALGRANSTLPRMRDQAAYRSRAGEVPRIVRMLLAAGASVKQRDWKWLTPIQTACASGEADAVVVRDLQAAGASMLGVARLNSTSRAEARRVVRARMFWGADMDVALVHYAANTGNGDVLRALLEAGADVDAKTSSGMRPLDLAVLHMRRGIVEILIEAGAVVEATVRDPFEMAQETTSWGELLEWLAARGWQAKGGSLSEWWTQGESHGESRSRVGQPEEIPVASLKYGQFM